MSLNYRAIGQRIMTIRKKKHLSQLTFSEMIDKSPAYVSYIETGKKSMSLDTFVQIANALYVPADLLLAEHLTGPAITASQEITMILTDCDDFERFVITNTLKSLKATMRDHKAILKHTDR
ncbi:MAG: helix-turn-helix transcriptional regulator [Candidatus Limiplasma sp.]|nr:helix-turn-helix transcriptional regulator [Candidatus Limiplasma sp.]